MTRVDIPGGDHQGTGGRHARRPPPSFLWIQTFTLPNAESGQRNHPIGAVPVDISTDRAGLHCTVVGNTAQRVMSRTDDNNCPSRVHIMLKRPRSCLHVHSTVQYTTDSAIPPSSRDPQIGGSRVHRPLTIPLLRTKHQDAVACPAGRRQHHARHRLSRAAAPAPFTLPQRSASMPYLALPYRIISYHIISYRVISCRMGGEGGREEMFTRALPWFPEQD
jgi:hypothetical protein